MVDTDEEHTVLSQPVGVSLFPTPFPRELFNEALALQETYNKLYHAVAEDEDWLYGTIQNLIMNDILSKTLWSIHQEVKNEGYIQDLTIDIFRSDYMLHVSPGDSHQEENIQLKQVEFNTVSCAGGAHANNISDMHRYLVQTGAYEAHDSNTKEDTIQITPSLLPSNQTVRALVSGISGAHRAYGWPKSSAAVRTCVLFIVQPRNFNIADERPLEYALWELTPSIPTFRLCFDSDVLEHTFLTPSRELLYYPPSRPKSSPMEVSVVYMRAGFEVREYDDIGRMGRLRLERSRAIKCPSILSHLTTLKKVQQALTTPAALERFLSAEEAARIVRTFIPIYPMDETSDAGRRARKLAGAAEAARNYVLKPSLEGGGHNIYGEDIPEFLAKVPNELWPSYVLMQKIRPPMLCNALISPGGLYYGRVISELGIFGICLWRRSADKNGPDTAETGPHIEQQLEAGWSFKTKPAHVNEMSVVKGYGCFDSPALVDRGTFALCCHQPEGAHQDDESELPASYLSLLPTP
jgi:glutathione synthetase